MDVYQSEKALQKQTTMEILRPPLFPAEKASNDVGTRRSRTREVGSRYKSPSPSTPSVPRRCPSPNITRTVGAPPSSLVPKRAHSVERRRPSTPPSPSTPVYDVPTDIQKLPSRRAGSGNLWPSTMRSLSVSFQSDTISIPISKREKPVVTHALSDRTLKPSSNVGHKLPEKPTVTRKPTPERKKSPLKGKNLSDQSENSKPNDSSHARLFDQHRWPSRTSGKVPSNSLNRSVDLTGRDLSSSSFRRGPNSEGTVTRPLQKSASDAANQLLKIGGDREEMKPCLADDSSRRLSLGSSERMSFSFNSNSMKPQFGSRPSSPSKSAVSLSRGPSPCRTRPSTPPSRGTSPSRIRPTSSYTQSNTSTSVLSFIADLKKGKKAANQIDDALQLRLMYNRHLQWRFVNARADSVMDMQRLTAENTLYNVWRNTSDLWELVVEKGITLQQLKLELKLNAVLNNQMAYLDDWASLERDHACSLSGAIDDLEASTLRLPLTGGARADVETIKRAISSALGVMQAIGSSYCSLLSRVEGINSLVSGLADVVALERNMLGECEALLASTSALQVEEYSIRSHLIQAYTNNIDQ